MPKELLLFGNTVQLWHQCEKTHERRCDTFLKVNITFTWWRTQIFHTCKLLFAQFVYKPGRSSVPDQMRAFLFGRLQNGCNHPKLSWRPKLSTEETFLLLAKCVIYILNVASEFGKGFSQPCVRSKHQNPSMSLLYLKIRPRLWTWGQSGNFNILWEFINDAWLAVHRKKIWNPSHSALIFPLFLSSHTHTHTPRGRWCHGKMINLQSAVGSVSRSVCTWRSSSDDCPLLH